MSTGCLVTTGTNPRRGGPGIIRAHGAAKLLYADTEAGTVPFFYLQVTVNHTAKRQA